MVGLGIERSHVIGDDARSVDRERETVGRKTPGETVVRRTALAASIASERRWDTFTVSFGFAVDFSQRRSRARDGGTIEHAEPGGAAARLAASIASERRWDTLAARSFLDRKILAASIANGRRWDRMLSISQQQCARAQRRAQGEGAATSRARLDGFFTPELHAP